MLNRTWRSARRVVAAAPLWFQSSLLGCGVFLVYVMTAWYGSRQNTDTWAAALAAWQLGQHGTLDLSGYDGGVPWGVDVGDQVFSNRFPGVILAGAPFYALLGSSVEPTIFPGGVAAAFWSAAAVGVCFAVCRQLVRTRLAAAASGVFAFATPTWSVSADALWTHGPDQFWLLLSVLLLSVSKPGLAGVPAAVTVLVRPHMALGWAGAGLHHLLSSHRVGDVVRFSLVTSLGAVLLVVYNWRVFGSPDLLGGYRDDHLTVGGVGALVFVVNVLGSLVSPHRGVLLLTPFLWLLMPGLRHAWRTAAPWVRSSAVAGLSYALVQLYLIRFIGGHGFYSYRTMIEPLTFLLPLLVCSYTAWTARTPGRRAAFNALVVVSVSFHGFGAVLDHHRVESGNPFREFSAVPVARDVGTAGTLIWLLVTALLVAYVLRRTLRSSRCDDTVEIASQREVRLQSGDDVVPAPDLLDPRAPGGTHRGREGPVQQQLRQPVGDLARGPAVHDVAGLAVAYGVRRTTGGPCHDGQPHGRGLQVDDPQSFDLPAGLARPGWHGEHVSRRHERRQLGPGLRAGEHDVPRDPQRRRELLERATLGAVPDDEHGSVRDAAPDQRK